MLIQTRSNFVKTSLPKKYVEAALKKIPFMVSITMEIDETAEFADIVLPDLHYLERLCLPISYPGQKSGEEDPGCGTDRGQFWSLRSILPGEGCSTLEKFCLK